MKTIVLFLSLTEQVDLWLQALSSQGLGVEVIPPEAELLDCLRTVPDLALVDIGIKSKDGSTLQASDVGRWFKSQKIDGRLVFINPKGEGAVKDLEKRWAVRQGAVEVLPRLDGSNLVSQMEVIGKLLGITLDLKALESIAAVPEAEQKEITSFGSLNDASAYCDRAKVRLSQHNLGGALYDIERAIEMDATVPEYFCVRAEILFRQGNLEGSLSSLDIALVINPSHKEAYFWRGVIRSSLGENQGAISEFDRAIKLDNKYSGAYNDRGLAKFNSGDERGALQDYNQALKIDPNFDRAFNNRGLLLYAQGNNRAAIEDFTRAIKINPNFADAYYNRANIFNDAGNFQQAIGDYTEAIRCNPYFAQAYGNRGLAHYELDDLRQALLDTQKAAELFLQQGDKESHQQALDTYRQMKS